MSRLRVRVELNRGGVGVPLHKLASVVHESQRFFEMLGNDVQIGKDRGEWLGFDFDNESLNFTAEYVGPVSSEQASAFAAAFDGVTSLRRATIAQFTRIADAIGEDELIGFGLYQSDQETEPSEWRSLSRRDALRIADEIQVLLGASGELDQESHLPAIIDTSAGARLFKDRVHRGAGSVEQSKLPELVREVESTLTKRIARLEDEVENHSLGIRDLRETSAATEESFKGLLSAVENFCGQATRQLERLAPPLEVSMPSTASLSIVPAPALSPAPASSALSSSAPSPAPLSPPLVPAPSSPAVVTPATVSPAPPAPAVLAPAALSPAAAAAPLSSAAVSPGAPASAGLSSATSPAPVAPASLSSVASSTAGLSSASLSPAASPAPVAPAPLAPAHRSPTPISVQPPAQAKSGQSWRALAVASVVVAALVASGLLFWPSKPADQDGQVVSPSGTSIPPASESSKAPEVSVHKPSETAVAEPSKPSAVATDANTSKPRSVQVSEQKSTPSEVPAVSGPDVMHVDLEAREPVWVMITDGDGKTLIARTLQPNETRSLEVATGTNLRTGNAGGLLIRLNGKDVGPLGPTGKIRNVEFKAGTFKITSLDAAETAHSGF